jgi:hypothetical protein
MEAKVAKKVKKKKKTKHQKARATEERRRPDRKIKAAVVKIRAFWDEDAGNAPEIVSAEKTLKEVVKKVNTCITAARKSQLRRSEMNRTSITTAKDLVGLLYSQLGRLQEISISAELLKARDMMVHSASVWQSFLESIPGGWEVGKVEGGISLLLPVADFKITDGRLKNVAFSNLVVKILLRNREDLSLNIVKKSGSDVRVHVGSTNRVHPHTNVQGRLCFGEGASAAVKARSRWDIISLYTLAVATLHTYNHQGAYTHLEHFAGKVGARCVVEGCWAWIPQDKVDKLMKECPRCKILHCLDCTKKFMGTEAVKCVICKEEQDKTNDKLKKEGRPVAQKVCGKCDSRTQRLHYTCSTCKMSVCSSHCSDCEDCASMICSNCSEACPICGGGHCKHHLSKNEELKKLSICDYCETYRVSSVTGYLKGREGYTDEMLEKFGF